MRIGHKFSCRYARCWRLSILLCNLAFGYHIVSLIRIFGMISRISVNKRLRDNTCNKGI